MDFVANDEPLPSEVLAGFARENRAWVAVDGASEIVGYVLVEDVDGAAHVEQVSVRRSLQGRGIGRMLLGRVEDWAEATGRSALTLTTFSDVPWNEPLYEHLGFRLLHAEEVGPELAAVMSNEAAHGLDPARRVVMRRYLP